MENIDNLDDNHLFDLIIQEIGAFGIFQKTILALSLIASLVAACNHLSPIYLTFTPNFKCVNGTAENQVRYQIGEISKRK